jgi:hypothetical protein
MTKNILVKVIKRNNAVQLQAKVERLKQITFVLGVFKENQIQKRNYLLV